MNPVERITDICQTVANGQTITHERLQWIIGLLVSILVLKFVLLVLAILNLHVKIVTRDEVREMKLLLGIVKDWANSARAHSRDAKDLTEKAKEQAPAAERHVLEAVGRVPEQTAERVVEKLKDGDSGSFNTGGRS